MDTYHLLYRFRDDPPDKIGQITGCIPDIYNALKGKIHKIDEFNLKDKDLQMIAKNRGDTIIMYDELPMSFCMVSGNYHYEAGGEGNRARRSHCF